MVVVSSQPTRRTSREGAVPRQASSPARGASTDGDAAEAAPVHPSLTVFDVDEASADPHAAVERLALLNAIIAASSATASLADLLPRVLDAVCARYPGLSGALARFSGDEMTIDAMNPPDPGRIDWPAIFSALPSDARRVDGSRAPLLLEDQPGGAILVPLAPIDGVSHALAFADRANALGIRREVMAAIALECSYVVDREIAAHQFQQREAQFRAAFDASPIAQALMMGDSHEFAVVNDALCRLVGYTREQLVGTSARTITHPDDIPVIERARRVAAEDPAGQRRVERRLIRASGEIVVTESTLTWIHMPGVPRMLLQQITDITAQRKAERELLRQTETDGLTGMPNRLRLVREISELGDTGREFAVLFLDVDSFKAVNDARGHAIGDEILIEIGRRLRDVAAESAAAGLSATAGRFGGDEFVVLCQRPSVGANDAANGGADHAASDRRGGEHVSFEQATRGLADGIRNSLAEPIETSDGPAHVTVSIGICTDTIPVARALDRLQYADTAAHQAKRLGEDRQVVYDSRLHRESIEYRHIESLLRTALEEQRFIVHYQPIVDIADGSTVGVEALVRMQDERGRLVPPLDFIEVAERSGLIVPMGNWVLSEACRTVADLHQQHGIPARVSVNVSARQVARPGLADVVVDALARSGLSSESLTLELTESALLEAEEATLESLQGLRERGVQIALDDFGTGYSSLTYLLRLPVTRLKVDRSFVDTMTTDPGSAAIVRTVTTLARDLGLSWVAEGVETEAQLRALRRLGPGLAQGFHFARPQPAHLLAHAISSIN